MHLLRQVCHFPVSTEIIRHILCFSSVLVLVKFNIFVLFLLYYLLFHRISIKTTKKQDVAEWGRILKEMNNIEEQ